MASVELSAAALQDLNDLIETRSLPSNALDRVKQRLEVLEAFPRIGRRLEGRWHSYRVLIGPWRWMLFVYLVLDEEDRVVIVTVQDARTGDAATHE
ncbi:MAG TPA: type II toxin-antitoxin system RelE/ParE family toxin [Thermoleophilaceae bacterium]|nr:type II toxin-antitoxin system RelE/ParE family toxin [Thermoleophilaceae bacterium]